MPIDWNRTDVQEALRLYRNRDGLSTLAAVQKKLEELTGTKIGKSTISDRLLGRTKHSGLGRPRKRPASPPPWLSTQQDDPPPLRAESNKMTINNRPRKADEAGAENIGEPRLSLSKCLNSSLISVPIGNGLVRTYTKNGRTSSDGKTVYFRCSSCHRLRTKFKSGPQANVKVKNGMLVGHETAVHHPQCKPILEQKAIVQETDRNCRIEVKSGKLKPREAWNRGHDYLGGMGLDSQFPVYKKVQSQYYRLKKRVKTPDNLPKQYKVLKKTAVMDKEGRKRWVFVVAAPMVKSSVLYDE